ncbi:MAG: Gfo/Idh/MocA family oxidoreductase [Pirellulales bacterium]|nr:Gfo/Idh/MocA family oxidoreductase [Pirellulales bacterium]
MDMPLNTLIVGGGSIGERHLRCFQQQPGVVVALCEPNERRRAELSSRYAVERTFSSLTEATEFDWNIGVICTPAQLHVEQAVRLLQRAPAVLIEKPLSTPAVAVDQLLAATPAKTVGVAYTYRSHPAVQAVRDLIVSGALGQVHQLTVVTGSHFPAHRPAYRDTYYAHRETGGGAIQDAATHLFDLAHYMTGPFDWIFCDAAHQSLPGVEVEDTVHATARADKNRVMISIAINQFMAPYEVTMQINGEQASARLILHEHRYGLFRLGDDQWHWHNTPIRERDDLFREQAKLFLEAALGRRPVACSVWEANHTLDISAAALCSAARGERLPIEGLIAAPPLQ